MRVFLRYRNGRARSLRACSRIGSAIVLLCFVLLSHSSVAQTNTIVLPPEAASTEGVGRGGVLLDRVKYQVIYGSDLFAGVPEDQILITGIAWRIDGLDKGSLDVVVPRIQISASTFLGGLMGVSRFPEENWGGDRVQVLDVRNVRFTGNYDPTLQNFQAPVAFDEPFYYDRRTGHLVLDLETSGPYPIPRNSAWSDVAASPSLRTVGVDGTGNPLVLHGADVLKVSYIPIPEPPTWSLLFLAASWLCFFKRP